MGRISGSRAAVRAGERLIAARGSIRAAWDSLGLGWSFDDLSAYLRGADGYDDIPDELRGKMLGIAAGVVILAVEHDRDRQHGDVAAGATFEVVRKEEGVVAPHGGDRMWGTLNGSTYCVLISRDPVGEGDLRWHISVSNEAHLQAGHDVPVWRDFVAIVHQLRPGVPFVVGIPPRHMWMNKNPNVLHAVEVRDEGLIAEWRRNAAGVAGTDAAVPS